MISPRICSAFTITFALVGCVEAQEPARDAAGRDVSASDAPIDGAGAIDSPTFVVDVARDVSTDACAPMEVCGDGLDNNCNTMVDDGCTCMAGQTQRCSFSAENLPPSHPRRCPSGVQTCDMTGHWTACNAARCDCVPDNSMTRAGTICGDIYDTAGTAMLVVPDDCDEMIVKAWGAGGGNASSELYGGAGGFALARFPVTPRETLTIYVGGAGRDGTTTVGGAGGEPGGGLGAGVIGNFRQPPSAGGGGGGFSGVFRGARTQANALVIAGGGGGGGGSGTRGSAGPAGAGGGLEGARGGAINIGGAGGTQLAGGAGATPNSQAGSALQGGGGNVPGGLMGRSYGGGGGGGGYFGVGGGVSLDSDGAVGGGGGGSGFVIPVGTLIGYESGMQRIPARMTDPDRHNGGAPGAAGALVISCNHRIPL